MRFAILASGSKGNAIWIENETDALLVDCGLSFKDLKQRADLLGLDITKLRGVLVTHSHTDHISGVGTLTRGLSIPAYANPETIDSATLRIGDIDWQAYPSGSAFQVASLEAQSIPVSHDAPGTVAYKLHSGDYTIGLGTDLGFVSKELTEALRGVSALIIESNHDYRSLIDGPYPMDLKSRVRSNVGHLSNAQAAALIKEIDSPALHYVLLAHISEHNNSPDKAIACAKSALGGRLTPVAAEQNYPVGVFSLDTQAIVVQDITISATERIEEGGSHD